MSFHRYSCCCCWYLKDNRHLKQGTRIQGIFFRRVQEILMHKSFLRP